MKTFQYSREVDYILLVNTRLSHFHRQLPPDDKELFSIVINKIKQKLLRVIF